MNDKTWKWIEAVLVNDENSTDEEMVVYFMREGPMTRKEAEKIVSMRSRYLGQGIGS